MTESGDDAQERPETYDEYSEITSAHLLPPSAVAPPAASSVTSYGQGSFLGDGLDGEPNLSDDDDDDDDNRGIRGPQIFMGEGAQLDDVEEEEPGPADDDEMPLEEEVDDAGEAEEDAVGEEDEIPLEEEEGGNERFESRSQESSAVAGASDGAPAFAISRVKQLLKFSCGDSHAPVVIVSNEAATAASHAVTLMLRDLTQAAAAITVQHNRKTISAADVALAVSQLDRFSFLSDVVPMPLAAKSRETKQQQRQNTSKAVAQRNLGHQKALRNKLRVVPQGTRGAAPKAATGAPPQLRQTTLI